MICTGNCSLCQFSKPTKEYISVVICNHYTGCDGECEKCLKCITSIGYKCGIKELDNTRRITEC